MGLFRNRSHFAVYILSQFKNVLRIGAAEIVGLVENLHPDSVIAGILHGRMLCGRCHTCFSSGAGSTDRLLLSNRLDLRQHLLTTQTLEFFFAFFQLLAQTLCVALRSRPGFSPRLVQLNGAIDLLFECLKIVRRNLGRCPFSHSHRHGATTSSRKLGTLAQYTAETISVSAISATARPPRPASHRACRRQTAPAALRPGHYDRNLNPVRPPLQLLSPDIS